MGKEKIEMNFRRKQEIERQINWLQSTKSEDGLVKLCKDSMIGTLQWVLGAKQSPSAALTSVELQRSERNARKAREFENKGGSEAKPAEGPTGEQVGKDTGEPV